MSCWSGVGKAANLGLLGVLQPDQAILRRVSVEDWPVTDWHR